ncbi:HpcH/HpaI aldolase family protein [Alteromonas oceanisediminis]|uniref:HpcH/HpaI aldolase family protein n=1 Tax=Alteromonas oceanisediminis TaxID=2836180 RepID=UPI001BD91718|nr:aldolase/citrate lyase family protein [Alteromonas oceanisediminis]MBT0585591.1 aldolase [Alteromonas oceanisediminis]
MKTAAGEFKSALSRKTLQIGTFMKTPSMMIAEVLALTQLDVCCIDAEHSPFDRKDIDAAVLAFRAHDKPVLVRLRDSSDSEILNALDCGASGIVVPHVDSPDIARQIVKKSYYGAAGRGYAGSSRFAKYTHSPLMENIQNSHFQTTIIAQIEDLAALACIDAIMEVGGIDCFFIGVMDLTVALGATDVNEPEVQSAVEKIVNSAKAFNRTLGMFVPSIEAVPFWQDKGVSLFLLNSDHGFIKQGVAQLLSTLKK